MRGQGEDGHLQAKGRGLRGNQRCWHLDLGLLVFRTVRQLVPIAGVNQSVVLRYSGLSELRLRPSSSRGKGRDVCRAPTAQPALCNRRCLSSPQGLLPSAVLSSYVTNEDTGARGHRGAEQNLTPGLPASKCQALLFCTLPADPEDQSEYKTRKQTLTCFR